MEIGRTDRMELCINPLAMRMRLDLWSTNRTRRGVYELIATQGTLLVLLVET